jgi:hypothetical protein
MSSEAVHVPRSVPGPSGTQGFRFAAEPIRFWATIAAAAVFLLMAAPRATILSVGYMQIQSLSSIRLNVLRSGGNLLVLYSLVMCMMKPTARRWLVWGLIAAFSTIYVGFLAGNRVETLGLLAGLSIAVQRRRGRRIPFWPVFLGGTLLYGILQAVGKIRLGATWQPESLLRLAASGSAMSFTQGDVALTTMVTLDLLKNELLHFDGGLVFLNILKATLPVFITPDRPISFAEVLNQLARTAGGSFVINEPFLAWGPLGIAACLAFLGALLAYLDFRPHRQLGLILFFTAVAGMPRLLLYGWAAFYKYLLTGAILYFGILWLSELLYFGTLSARLAGLRRDSGHRNLS